MKVIVIVILVALAILGGYYGKPLIDEAIHGVEVVE